MKPLLFAVTLAVALGAATGHAADATDATPAMSAATPFVAVNGTDPADGGSRNKQPAKVQDLDAVSVSATLDQARNALSPDTGTSQYVIDHRTIVQLPLGASTPMNQVLLQAPGVVQDSHGGLHVRGDHANLQYRINGVIIPESIGGFGQSLDARMVDNVKLLDGALPAQYGLRTAAVVDITTKSGHDLGTGGSVGITGGSNG
ncbi:MAG TPA: TonB-dependent receptor, partial [Rhodanobacter sp.]